MAEYIEREAAIKEFSNNGSIFVYGKQECKAIVSRLNTIPAADVRPVVRGKWKKRTDVAPFKPDGEITSWTYKCSNCGELSRLEYNFCPNCGARMDLEEEIK